MRLNKTLAIALLFLKVISYSAQTNAEESQARNFPASEIVWAGPFGMHKATPKNMYLLMSQGAFRAPTCPEFPENIRQWIQKHPGAEAVPVLGIGPASSQDPSSELVYIWIQDKSANLQIDLVRQGCMPAGTTVLKQEDKPLVSTGTLKQFFDLVWEAETEAKNKKLGIWKDPDN